MPPVSVTLSYPHPLEPHAPLLPYVDLLGGGGVASSEVVRFLASDGSCFSAARGVLVAVLDREAPLRVLLRDQGRPSNSRSRAGSFGAGSHVFGSFNERFGYIHRIDWLKNSGYRNLIKGKNFHF